MQRDRDVSLGMHEAYHDNDMQVIVLMRLTSICIASAITRY